MADRDDDARTPAPPFRIGDWCVKPVLGAIRCGENLRHLEPKVMDALVVLARKAGGVLTKVEITDAVWKLHDGDEIRLGRDAVVLRFSAGTSATRAEESTPSDAS
jgi:DNA-binding response OmpR family regulator